MLLESIIEQLSGLTEDDLEILIFDNYSTDDTQIVVERYSSKNSLIKYEKNQENIGPDCNFIKAFNSARGQYLWMLGDDELLFKGTLLWVLKLCKDRKFGCVYLSSIPETFSQIHYFLGRSIAAPIKIRRFNLYQFMQIVNYRITFLSGTIVNKQKLIEFNSKINQDIEKYSKSNLVHLTWVFSAILSMPFSYYVETPTFATTIANSSGYNPVKVFVVNLSDLFSHYFSIKNTNAKNFIRHITLIGWFPKVVFDIRFSKKYESTGFAIDVEQFPKDMKCGLNWLIFNSMVIKGPKSLSFIGMLYLKFLHKLTQTYFLLRGKRVS